MPSYTFRECVEPEFSYSRESYIRRFTLGHIFSEASSARRRRLSLFKNASGLIEETRFPSFRHNEIADAVRYIDHESLWWYKDIPFFMTEPPIRPHKALFPNLVGVMYFVVPDNIAPYGQGGYSLKNSTETPNCAAYLFVKTVHARFLNRVASALIAASRSAPPWNALTYEPLGVPYEI